MSNWLVIRTRPRWEKKVNRLLIERGVTTFCPVQEVKRQWSDRVKRIQQPVFQLYVFVKISEQERTAVRMTSGVVNFVVKDRKLVIIREKTILGIKEFQKKYYLLEVKTASKERTMPVCLNGTLFIEELDMCLVGLMQSHFITESTDKYY